MNNPLTVGNREVILVVDDNKEVLSVVVAILEAKNYEVFSATSGEAALQIAAERTEKIDLLLSDVEMRGMSGPDLGEAMKKSRPDLRIMLMSGGSRGSLLVLNYGWAYIQKPFVGSKLSKLVKDVLTTPNRCQAGGHEYDSQIDIDIAKGRV